MGAVFLCPRRSDVQPTDYSQLDENRISEKRIYLLRSSLFGTLTVTGVLYGIWVYYYLSGAQEAAAGKEFKSLAAQAGKDIRQSFLNSACALSYLAERYATTFPDEADWPTVYLPGFNKVYHMLY
jgi:hypothetical protein